MCNDILCYWLRIHSTAGHPHYSYWMRYRTQQFDNVQWGVFYNEQKVWDIPFDTIQRVDTFEVYMGDGFGNLLPNAPFNTTVNTPYMRKGVS